MQICPVNYSGSAPGMEAVGACRIWQRSEEKNKLRYTTFLGDGDNSWCFVGNFCVEGTVRPRDYAKDWTVCNKA